VLIETSSLDDEGGYCELTYYDVLYAELVVLCYRLWSANNLLTLLFSILYTS